VGRGGEGELGDEGLAKTPPSPHPTRASGRAALSWAALDINSKRWETGYRGLPDPSPPGSSPCRWGEVWGPDSRQKAMRCITSPRWEGLGRHCRFPSPTHFSE